jgi:uncharacterized protein
MNEQIENVNVVKKFFKAVGRGEMNTAMELLTADVEWTSPVTRNPSNEISWSKTRHGPEEVDGFFRELIEKVEIEAMKPLEFTAQENRVVVEGKNKGVIRSTGRAYEHDWVMVFNLKNGKIAEQRH